MINEFGSIQELYERVLPALKIKTRESKMFRYNNINEIDIWRYLTDKTWKSSKNLMLFDIVDDILNVDLLEIDQFINRED